MKELSFPENITLEKEIAPGLLRKDLKKLLALAVPGAVIGIAIWALSGHRPLTQLVAMVSTLLYLFLCYAIVVRVDGTTSIYSYLALLVRFYREQQSFSYKQPKEVLYRVESTGSEEADRTGIYQC